MTMSLVELRAAVHQWTAFASEAERHAHRRQRDTVLDLLQAARQIALGIDAVNRLIEAHAHHSRLVGSVAVSSDGLIARLEARTEPLSTVLRAAERASASSVALSVGDRKAAVVAEQLRRETTALLAECQANLRGVEAALTSARSARSTAGHLLSTLDAVGIELDELRKRFDGLGRQAAESLATLRSAGTALISSAEFYEAAQRAAVDLRREALTPPTGAPLSGPGVPPVPVSATEPAEAALVGAA